jgi:hypothetical protein
MIYRLLAPDAGDSARKPASPPDFKIALRSKPLELIDDLQGGTLLKRTTRRTSRPRRLIQNRASLQTA